MIRSSRGGTRPVRAGFTLVEVVFIAALLLIAVGGLSGAVVTSRQLSRATDETARADLAARDMAERLFEVPFSDIFATFNTDADDDPGGPGTAPGAGFAVAGLAPTADDPDGMCGEIVFPAQDVAGVLQLLEGLDMPAYGMPRDLNGDGDDDDDASDDYVILPVTIRISWLGTAGEQRLEISQILYE